MLPLEVDGRHLSDRRMPPMWIVPALDVLEYCDALQKPKLVLLPRLTEHEAAGDQAARQLLQEVAVATERQRRAVSLYAHALRSIENPVRVQLVRALRSTRSFPRPVEHRPPRIRRDQSFLRIVSSSLSSYTRTLH